MTQRFFIISFIALFSLKASADVKLKSFQTTRLMQSAGAGVGSLLLNEATVLNPATTAFFTTSTLYYQKDKVELNDKDSSRNYDYDDGLNEFINITDTSTKIKGAFSYLNQHEEFGKRRWISLSGSSPISDSASFGMSYRFIEEDSDVRDEEYSQFTFGFLYNQSESLSVGFTYVDPTIIEPHYSHYTLGAHFRFNEFIGFLADVGSGDMENSDKSAFTKYALQLNPFLNTFIRYGRFHDKFENLKGFGYGVSWVGPKFSIDFAVKQSQAIEERDDEFLEDEVLSETSFGISGIF